MLLKGLAAVAEVPRPEDVGFDGVATLLREGDSGLLYAEDSFYVQIKTSSFDPVTYEGHEAEWLKKLKLPFFIGSVDTKDATLSLYTTFRLSQVMLESPYPKLVLHLKGVAEKSDVGVERVFNIGPPLLRWGFGDLQSSEFRSKAFAMLKTVIDAEMRNIRHRVVKYIEGIQWETNAYASVSGIMMMGGTSGCSEMQLLETMSPYVSALTMQYMDTSTKDPQDVRAVHELIQLFRRRNIGLGAMLGAGDWMRHMLDTQKEKPVE